MPAAAPQPPNPYVEDCDSDEDDDRQQHYYGGQVDFDAAAAAAVAAAPQQSRADCTPSTAKCAHPDGSSDSGYSSRTAHTAGSRDSAGDVTKHAQPGDAPQPSPAAPSKAAAAGPPDASDNVSSASAPAATKKQAPPPLQLPLQVHPLSRSSSTHKRPARACSDPNCRKCAMSRRPPPPLGPLDAPWNLAFSPSAPQTPSHTYFAPSPYGPQAHPPPFPPAQARPQPFYPPGHGPPPPRSASAAPYPYPPPPNGAWPPPPGPYGRPLPPPGQQQPPYHPHQYQKHPSQGGRGPNDPKALPPSSPQTPSAYSNKTYPPALYPAPAPSHASSKDTSKKSAQRRKTDAKPPQQDVSEQPQSPTERRPRQRARPTSMYDSLVLVQKPPEPPPEPDHTSRRSRRRQTVDEDEAPTPSSANALVIPPPRRSSRRIDSYRDNRRSMPGAFVDDQSDDDGDDDDNDDEQEDSQATLHPPRKSSMRSRPSMLPSHNSYSGNGGMSVEPPRPSRPSIAGRGYPDALEAAEQYQSRVSGRPGRGGSRSTGGQGPTSALLTEDALNRAVAKHSQQIEESPTSAKTYTLGRSRAGSSRDGSYISGTTSEAFRVNFSEAGIEISGNTEGRRISMMPRGNGQTELIIEGPGRRESRYRGGGSQRSSGSASRYDDALIDSDTGATFDDEGNSKRRSKRRSAYLVPDHVVEVSEDEDDD